MFIVNVVIDGFKSYGKETVIAEFDPNMNVITGLSGTGKSNILDAICFVLSIKNLRMLRVSKLKELLFKGSYSSVTKASVSILFDNCIKSKSPNGYESYDELTISRQISMSGECNYLINGKNVTDSQVEKLFKTANLNITNTNLLIIQGRFTKVLNLKPLDILSLFEEATETNIYNDKLATTLNTIKKSDIELLKLDKLIEEELSPKIEIIQQNDMILEKITSDINHWYKFIIAYRFTKLMATVYYSEQPKKIKNKEEDTIIKCNDDKKLEKGVANMSQMRVNDPLQIFENLDVHFSELQIQEALLNSAVTRTNDALKVLKETLEKLEKEKFQVSDKFQEILQMIAIIGPQYEGLQTKMEDDKILLDNAIQKLKRLSTDESGKDTIFVSEILSNAGKNLSDRKLKWKMDQSVDQQEKNHGNMNIKLNELNDEIVRLELVPNLADTEQKLIIMNEEYGAKKLQHEQANMKTFETKEMTEAQMKALQEFIISNEHYERSDTNFQNFKHKYNTLPMDFKSNQDDRNRIDLNITNVKAEIKQKEIEDLEQMKFGRVFDEKMEEKKKLLFNKDTSDFTFKDNNVNIEKYNLDNSPSVEELTKMLYNNAWILDEAANFGKKESMYDFESNSLRDAEQKLEKLEDQKQQLSGNVNMRSIAKLVHMVERLDDVKNKYYQVSQNKAKLQEVIDDLDKRKDEVLKKAHEQVDRDFDKMFSTLLPGSRARLTPPEGKTLKDGLEFRISFGNVGMESLTELSGGQRSLVALSLILALLLFKPAPLYILDEVDAALDISHTQNIGTIIKEQFSHSQFIIVSLKDGMFNNANVLYKTKLVDGVSTVSRHVYQAPHVIDDREK